MKLWPFGKKKPEERSGTSNPAQWLVDWVHGDVMAPNTALKIAAVWACVRNISEDEAKVPLITYKRLERGKERATKHNLYSLLKDAPNDDQSAFDWRSTMTQYALLRGNGCAEIIRDQAGNVVALSEPLDPDRITPKRVNGMLFYEIKNGAGEPITLSQDRIFHIKGMGDGVWGYSVVQYAKEVLVSSRSADQLSTSLFKNGLNVEGVLTHPGKLGAPAIENLRKSLKDVHGGSENAGKQLILEEGMTWTARGIPPQEAQFIESRQFSIPEICRWFRMPPHKVADLTRATFSNIEQQSLEYVTDTLMPWFVRWEQEISRKLLRPSERQTYFAEHMVNGLLRGDSAARSAFYREQWNIGAMSANDICEAENRNPIDGGDTYFVPLNMIPLKTALTMPPPAPKEPNKDPAARMMSHESLLVSAFQRVLFIERDRAQSAAKKSQLAEWRERFYETHPAHVRAAILTACELAAGEFDPNYAENPAFQAELTAICADHCKRSAREAVDERTIESWGDCSRAREQAADTIKRIIKATSNG